MSLLYICNWKMYLNSAQQKHLLARLIDGIKRRNNSALALVVCPPCTAMESSGPELFAVNVALGGQDCSKFVAGAYTGQISAAYLKELGCTYCMVGHAEVRLYGKDDDAVVLQKARNSLQQGLVPVICVGAGVQATDVTQVCHLVQEQVSFYMQGLKEFGCIKICFAYEPAAAIGSGKVANKQEINAVMACIKQASAQLPDVDVRCLYGGSVDEFSIIELKKITSVDGFLIGRASTDFQKLEKIIF